MRTIDIVSGFARLPALVTIVLLRGGPVHAAEAPTLFRIGGGRAR